MSWHQFHKGQTVLIRALGGWIKGHVSEVYDASASVVHDRGSQVITTRIHDLRSIRPWQNKSSKPSTLNDQQSFDF
jgi:hypothetical protein